MFSAAGTVRGPEEENRREHAIARRCQMAESRLPELWEWAEYY
jgi:hypothetical protein